MGNTSELQKPEWVSVIFILISALRKSQGSSAGLCSRRLFPRWQKMTRNRTRTSVQTKWCTTCSAPLQLGDQKTSQSRITAQTHFWCFILHTPYAPPFACIPIATCYFIVYTSFVGTVILIISTPSTQGALFGQTSRSKGGFSEVDTMQGQPDVSLRHGCPCWRNRHSACSPHPPTGDPCQLGTGHAEPGWGSLPLSWTLAFQATCIWYPLWVPEFRELYSLLSQTNRVVA